MITNQISRRNHNPILFMMLLFCCLCPDFGLSHIIHHKRQMPENRTILGEEVVDPQATAYINPIFEKCTLYSLGKRKEAFQETDICNLDRRLKKLKSHISHMLCDTHRLIKIFLPFHSGKERLENSTRPIIYPDAKQIIREISEKVFTSVDDISKIQQEYIAANFDPRSKDLLQRLEEFNNNFKNTVIKYLIFNARCEEIELCPVKSKKKSWKKRNNNNNNNNYSTARFQKNYIRLLERIGKNLLESLDILKEKPNDEKPTFDKEACPN